MNDDTSRAAFRALFDSAADAMVVMDDRARIVDANLAAATLRGEPRDALIGRWIGEFTTEDARERGTTEWPVFLTGGEHRRTDRLLRVDGTELEVEYAATANFIPGRHLWTLRDVSERNRALREVQFHANLLDHVEAAVVAVDLNWRVTHWNRAAERLYGVERAEAIGRLVQDLVVAEGAEGEAAEVAEHVSAGRSWEGEFLIRCREGDPVTAWVVNAPIPDGAGGLAGYVGVAVDMTERRETARELERSRAALQAMLGSALDAVVAMDLDGRAVEFNPAAEATFGFRREHVLGKDLLGLIVAPDLLPEFRAQLERFRETGEAWPLNERVEVAARRADGSPFPVELSATAARLEDGSTIFTAYIRDITERRQTQALLTERAEQQEAVAELGQKALRGEALAGLMQEAVATVGGILGTDAVALLELDDAESELILRAALAPAADDGPERFRVESGTVLAALATGQPVVVEDWATETRFKKHPALDEVGVASLVDVVVGGAEQGRPWGVLSATSTVAHRFSRHDVNFVQAVAHVLAGAIERHRVEDSIRHRALHDDLTGLPNRALFLDRLEHALAQMDRRGSTVAVVFVDIDQFKVVNDSLGHQAGDRLLQSIVPRLNATLRPGDTLARFGGDEFVVLCEGLEGEDAAISVGERLLASFDQPFELGDRDHYASASLGVALPRQNDQDAEALIRDADAAMYRAKERGRARVELFDERMRVRTLTRLRIDNDLRGAVLGRDLEVHYQPIVSLADGDVAGFEALMRWHHPGRGDVTPAEFIPVAEESGLISGLGRWALEEAAAQGVRWRGLAGARAEPLAISVNLSVRQFSQGALVDEVAEVLATSGLEPGRLMLEITESVLMDEADASLEDLHALKALGVKLVLDDFGTGYSSLSYLERFPIDALKIDRSFVAMLDSGGSAAIVDAIVSMAHSLDMRVTAEGVETEQQIDHLRRIGCEFAQGWYFGRPGPPEMHDDLISSRLAG